MNVILMKYKANIYVDDWTFMKNQTRCICRSHNERLRIYQTVNYIWINIFYTGRQNSLCKFFWLKEKLNKKNVLYRYLKKVSCGFLGYGENVWYNPHIYLSGLVLKWSARFTVLYTGMNSLGEARMCE